MTDLDDILEGIFDIEDIAEEIFEPDELIEDFLERPKRMASALLAIIATIFTIIFLLITVVLILLATGPIIALALTGLLTLIGAVLCVAIFLHLRTDIPSDVRKRIEDAMNKAEDERSQYEDMSEKKAVENLKSKYVNGEISEEELDKALDETLGNNDPKQVVRQYN